MVQWRRTDGAMVVTWSVSHGQARKNRPSSKYGANGPCTIGVSFYFIAFFFFFFFFSLPFPEHTCTSAIDIAVRNGARKCVVNSATAKADGREIIIKARLLQQSCSRRTREVEKNVRKRTRRPCRCRVPSPSPGRANEPDDGNGREKTDTPG